jgi:hypothetical protein
MRADMSAGPRDCSVEFRKRRNRLILIAFPIAAAMLVAFESFGDPSFQVYGLNHVQTLWLGIGATAVLLGLNLIDWRCPNCNVYLNSGISVPFCKQCGALFVPPPAGKEGPAGPMSYPETSPEIEAGVRRAQAESALQSEINEYRNNCVLRIMKAVVVVGLGALMSFVLDTGDPQQMSRGGWIYQSFGEAGAANAGKVMGGTVMILGLAWITWEARSMATAKRRLTEKYRDLLRI